MTDSLTPDEAANEARERLSEHLRHYNWALMTEPPSTGWDARRDLLVDAILATTDALAALVDWPALLAAGLHAGKLCHGVVKGRDFRVRPSITRLTDPEAAP